MLEVIVGAKTLLLGLSLVLISGCTNTTKITDSRRTTGEKGGADGESAKPSQRDALPATDNTGSFTFSNEKFSEYSGQTIRAEVSFQTRETSHRITFRGGKATIPIEDLHLNKPEDLIIKFYADDTYIYKAEKKDVEFSRDGEAFTLANCRIRSVNWDGLNHEGNCSWAIGNAAN